MYTSAEGNFTVECSTNLTRRLTVRMRPYVALAFVTLLTCATYPAFAQAVPAATEGRSPWAIGAGISGYNSDYHDSRLLGGTLWIDYTFTRVPSFLQGLSMEVEARDLNYDRTAKNESALRQDTAGGGLIYSWRHFNKLRPYAKLLAEYGNCEYGEKGGKKGSRGHDSRNFLGVGGGVEYLVTPRLWLRADYEYQSWPDFAGTPSGRLKPQGITVGAMYHFGSPRIH